MPPERDGKGFIVCRAPQGACEPDPLRVWTRDSDASSRTPQASLAHTPFDSCSVGQSEVRTPKKLTTTRILPLGSSLRDPSPTSPFRVLV